MVKVMGGLYQIYDSGVGLLFRRKIGGIYSNSSISLLILARAFPSLTS